MNGRFRIGWRCSTYGRGDAQCSCSGSRQPALLLRYFALSRGGRVAVCVVIGVTTGRELQAVDADAARVSPDWGVGDPQPHHQPASPPTRPSPSASTPRARPSMSKLLSAIPGGGPRCHTPSPRKATLRSRYAKTALPTRTPHWHYTPLESLRNLLARRRCDTADPTHGRPIATPVIEGVNDHGNSPVTIVKIPQVDG